MLATSSQQAQDTAMDETTLQWSASDSGQLRQAAQRLADRAVSLYRWRAGLWWLGSALLATLLLIAGDFLLHVEEAGLRWLLSLAWLAALVATAWRWFPPAWRFSLGPVRVAQWIERSRPELGGRLSNMLAIAELPESDTRFGSASFRRAALHSATSQPLAIDWRSYLDWRPTLVAGLGTLALSMAAVGLAVAFPQVASRGMARLLRPWHSLPWPHADQLEIVQLPTMIASGSELPIEAIDSRPPLPATVELQILSTDPDQPGGPKRLVRMPMRVLENVALATITDMRGDFAVRVVGGDDLDSAWHDVRVAELPELLEHQFNVTPPAYSRQPPTELVGERIEVLSGSQVTFQGRYSDRIRSLIAEAAPSTTAAGTSTPTPAAASSERAVGEAVTSSGSESSAEVAASWPATLAADRQSFDLFVEGAGGLVVGSDRRWRLRLQTEDGLELTEPKSWSIHVVADRPPTVNLVPIEPPLATRDSVVEIVGQASDDLELIEVRLVWQTGEGAEPHGQTLWQPSAEPLAARPNSDESSLGSASASAEPTAVQRQASISYSWRPGPERLPLAQPVTVYLEARDSLGQITRSVSQTLQLEEPQTVLAHLQAEQAKTFEPLRQLLNAQRRNEQAIKRTRDIVAETKTVTPEQLDTLATARQLQQSIAQQLAHAPASILEKLRALDEQLERNALSGTELADQIERLTAEINRLDGEAIAPALKTLDGAQQAMRTALEPTASEAEQAAVRSQLDKTAARQQQATNGLSRLVDSIATAETIASLQKEFSDLQRRQNDLRVETERFQVDRVAHPEARNAESTRIGLRSDQLSLARDIDDLIANIDQQLKETDPAQEPAQKTLEQARQALVDLRVSQTMRKAAEKIDAEQLADGIRAQRAAAGAIARAAAEFGGNGAATLQSSTATLQAIAEQLGGLAGQQSELAEALQAPNASQSAPALAARQAELSKSADELKQDLEQQANHSLGAAVEAGQQLAAQAAREAGQSNLAQASQKAQQAAEKFREAQQNAQQRAAELEKQLATQQLLDLGAAVEELVQRQTPLVDRLNELQQLGADESARPADWGAQLRNASAEQQVVLQHLVETAAQMQDLDTFAWLLNQCEIDMARAAAALEREQLEPDGLSSAASALRKLSAAAQALTPPEPGSAEPAEGNNSDTDKAADEPGERNDKQRPSLASLKLLRALQIALHEETRALQAKGQNEQGLEMARLADEQQALAEQAQKLTRDILK